MSTTTYSKTIPTLSLCFLLAAGILFSPVAQARTEAHRTVTLEHSAKDPLEVLRAVPGVRIVEGEELRVVAVGEREWTLAGEQRQVGNATALLSIHDALAGHKFFKEPNLLTGTEASERRISFAVEEIDTIEFLRFVAANAGWSVIFDASVRDGSAGALTLSLDDTAWDSAIETVLERQKLRAVPFGQVWILASRERGDEIARNAELDPCEGEDISVSLECADLVETLQTFGTLAGLKMVLPPDLTGSVTLELTAVPWDNVLQALLLAHGLQYRIEDGTVFIEEIPGTATGRPDQIR